MYLFWISGITYKGGWNRCAFHSNEFKLLCKCLQSVVLPQKAVFSQKRNTALLQTAMTEPSRKLSDVAETTSMYYEAINYSFVMLI